MKGIGEIEFIISVFVFITTISFVTVMIINTLPVFHSASVSDSLRAKSWQYSQMLVFDEGYPKNWQGKPWPEIERIGFSTGGWYVIDRQKIDALKTMCDQQYGYDTAKAKLGITENDIKIEVTYTDGSPVESSAIVCSPNIASLINPEFQVSRLAVLAQTGAIVRIRVTVS